MQSTDEHVDYLPIDGNAKILPPLHSLMTYGERIATFRFLRAIAQEIDLTLTRLRSVNPDLDSVYMSGQIRYWDHALAGIKLAMSRTGIKEGDLVNASK